MFIDPSLTGKENVLLLLAQRLSEPVSAEMIQFGLPTSVDIDEGLANTNTKVIIEAEPGSGFSGHLALYYRRLDLAEFVLEQPYYHPLTGDETVASLLTTVCHHLNVRSSDVSLSLSSIPEVDAPLSIQIVANQSSLLYVGKIEVLLLPPE